jgi:hypothetical protein
MLKNKENTIRLIGLALVVILFIFIANYFSVNKNLYHRMLEQRIEESYSGVILEKYIDKAEHSTPMLKFTNNKVISLENIFWDQVSAGDSIVKKENEAYITLYKNNGSKIKFDYNDYFNDLSKNSK